MLLIHVLLHICNCLVPSLGPAVFSFMEDVFFSSKEHNIIVLLVKNNWSGNFLSNNCPSLQNWIGSEAVKRKKKAGILPRPKIELLGVSPGCSSFT